MNLSRTKAYMFSEGKPNLYGGRLLDLRPLNTSNPGHILYKMKKVKCLYECKCYY